MRLLSPAPWRAKGTTSRGSNMQSPPSPARIATFLALLLGLMAQISAAQAPSPTDETEVPLPTFLYPTQGLIINTFDTIRVQYISWYRSPNMYTFCVPGVGRQIMVQPAPGFNGSIDINLNFTSDVPCWFNIRASIEGKYGANSHTFNILGERRPQGSRLFALDEQSPSSSPVPSSSSSSSSTASSAAQTPTTTPSPLPPPSTNSGESQNPSSGSGNTTLVVAASENQGGLSVDAKIAVGVVVPFLVLGLACGLIFWYRRRKRRLQGGQEKGVHTPANELHGSVPPPPPPGDAHFLPPSDAGKYAGEPVPRYQSQYGQGHGHGQNGYYGASEYKVPPLGSANEVPRELSGTPTHFEAMTGREVHSGRPTYEMSA